MRNYRLWLTAVLVALAFPVSAGESVSIAVSPRHAFSPANLTVRVHLEPNRENRILEVVADSERFYRSSQIQLEGEHAPRTIVVEFRDVPPGEYEVSSVLLNAAGRRRAAARQDASVLSSRAEQ